MDDDPPIDCLNQSLRKQLKILLPDLSLSDFGYFCQEVDSAISSYEQAGYDQCLQEPVTSRHKRAKNCSYYAKELRGHLLQEYDETVQYTRYFLPDGERNWQDENNIIFDDVPITLDAGGEGVDTPPGYPTIKIDHPFYIFEQLLDKLIHNADEIADMAIEEKKMYPRARPTFPRMVLIEAIMEACYCCMMVETISIKCSYYEAHDDTPETSPYKGVILYITQAILEHVGIKVSISTTFDDIKKIKTKWKQRSIDNGFHEQE